MLQICKIINVFGKIINAGHLISAILFNLILIILLIVKIKCICVKQIYKIQHANIKIVKIIIQIMGLALELQLIQIPIVKHLILNALLITLQEMLNVKQNNISVICIQLKLNALLLLRVLVFGVECNVFYPILLAHNSEEQTMQPVQHLDHFVIKLLLVQLKHRNVHHMYVLIKQDLD